MSLNKPIWKLRNWINPKNLNWRLLSENPDKINWLILSRNSNIEAIKMLEENEDKIKWNVFS